MMSRGAEQILTFFEFHTITYKHLVQKEPAVVLWCVVADGVATIDARHGYAGRPSVAAEKSDTCGHVAKPLEVAFTTAPGGAPGPPE